MLIIDSHTHTYSPDEWSYPPAQEARRPAAGIGSLQHLQETCKANGVSAAVVIQTHSFYRWDNRYMSHLAATQSDWIAGVCALDPEDPKGPAILTELVRDYSVRGVRILTLNSGHLDVPEVRRLWAKATELGLVINVVTSTAHTDQLASLLRAFPTATAVLEHSLCINRVQDKAESLRALGSLAHSRCSVQRGACGEVVFQLSSGSRKPACQKSWTSSFINSHSTRQPVRRSWERPRQDCGFPILVAANLNVPSAEAPM